ADKARPRSNGREKAQGAHKTREIAKAISARSNGGENAQGADKALVEARAGTGAREASPKNRTLTQTATGQRSGRPKQRSALTANRSLLIRGHLQHGMDLYPRQRQNFA